MQEPMAGSPSSPLSASRLRIICLCQGAVDAVCALGLQSCLVGRSHHCTGPATFLSLPCVSSSDSKDAPEPLPHCNFNDQNVLDSCNINWELLQELKPDLIFFQGPPSRVDTHIPILAQQFTQRKCRIVSLQSHTVEDIFRNLETTASFCGVNKEGAKLVTLLRTQWKSVKQLTPQWADGMPHVNVAFLSSVNPLVGAGCWVPEIISCAGGLSSLGKAGCPSKPLTLEDLAQANPDVVLYLSFRFHVGSLATELSWLLNRKEWKNLKAIKGNRFFVINANRFFIDSAPNIISSTELLTEILHGFGYGHEGIGFIRWQFSSKGEHHAKIKFENKLPASFTDKCATAFSMDVDKHEVCSSASQAYPKYVTNVYEVRNPALLQENSKPNRDLREKPDVWHGELGDSKSKRKDALQDAFVDAVDRHRCLETKSIIPDKFEKTYMKDMEGHAFDRHDEWEIQIAEELSHNEKDGELVQVTLGPMDSFNIGDQKERNADLRLAQTRCFSTASSHHLPAQQRALGKVASSTVHRYENSSEENLCDVQMIPKIWAFTESAAEMRRRSSPFTPKQKVFHKSVSLPVSRRQFINIDSANDEVRLSAEIPNKTNSFYGDDDKPFMGSTSLRLSAKDPSKDSLSDVKWDKARETQSFVTRRHEGKSASDALLKRRLSYSVPSSPKVDVIPRISRRVRDLVLKSLVDLKYLDCLLLSGGLASSILAEAVPMVHSKGFRVGITVLAGPAATDKASAAVAAKCKGMQHVIIGEGEKGFAVFLLAKELAFIVETLKTFDPFQVRNLVPIAAALREAKSRGFELVVTGDGLEELLFRDRIQEKNANSEIPKVLSRSAVLLGEALGVKVVQPFLNPKLVQECKALFHTYGLAIGPTEHGRATLREAFPEVSAACSEKAFNEVDSGMFYVSDYFSSAISGSVLESKAKSIFRKERIRIRDAEHLVYYRAFRKVFKGNVPRGTVRWASKPCFGCGYQLSISMSSYCLVCGLSQQSRKSSTQEHVENARQEPLIIKESEGREEVLKDEVRGDICRALDAAECEAAKEISLVASVGSTSGDSQHGSSEEHRMTSAQHKSPVGKPVKSSKRRGRKTQMPSKETKPNYWALLGAGSAGLLLLLQLSRR